MNQDKISFTAPYDNKGYLTVFDIDEKKLEKAKKEIAEKLKKEKLSQEDFDIKFEEELNQIQSVNTKVVKLDWQDEIALVNIDALKEELVNMVRKKRDSGKDSFELTPEKANKMHDDRAYTACMISYALMQERRKSITQRSRKNSEIDIASAFPIRQARRNSYL
jgi:hypothetical protein